MGKQFLSVFIGVLFSFKSFCLTPTYGAEFEFFHKELTWDTQDIEGPAAIKAKNIYLEKVKETCLRLKCKIIEIEGKFTTDYRVEFQDGWYFEISHDPGVIEIKFKPSTLVELRDKKSIINDAIFGSAHRGGFYTDRENTAHFNMGVLSAFEGNAKDFLRFFVDYHNNPHLALGTLGEDFDNAPPLSILDSEQRDELQKIIKEVEQGKFKNIGSLASAITERVYVRSYNPEWGGAHHYQAIGLKYITKYKLLVSDRPLELRAIWSQKNAEHFIRLAELIEARVNFLKTQHNSPIVYYPSDVVEIPTWTEIKTRFYIYVTEMGLDFDRYKFLMPIDAWDAPFAPFLDGNISSQKRVASLAKYADLTKNSEWFRNYSNNLIEQSYVQNDPQIKIIIATVIKKFESSGYKPSLQTVPLCHNAFLK